MPASSSNAELSSESLRPRVGVLGATLGTGNLGVDALGMSMVQGLVTAIPHVEIVYQTWDLRIPVTIPLGESTLQCEPLAIRRKGSLRRRDGLPQMRRLAKARRLVSGRSRTWLPTFSHPLRQLLSCDTIVDVSAGDSFATIYGKDVFWYQTQIKLLCLELGLPLVLMPQTYGPFADSESEQVAAHILSRAKLVCSREAEGLREVEALCGERPPQQLVRVPDMAFLLEPRETALPPKFLQAKSQMQPCIALNISGLLYYARRSFGLSVNYQELVQKMLQWALSIPHSHILLVPHVVAPTFYSAANNSTTKVPSVASSDRTDTTACSAIAAGLDASAAARVEVLSDPQDPAQAKYAMGLCDFFIGARMHAFIGAVSQGVPGALLAYSKKADGLARLLGISDSVIDLRSASIEDCVAELDAQYQRKHATKEHLESRIPQAKDELRRFFSEAIAPLVLGEAPTSTNRQFQHHNVNAEPAKKEVLS